MKINCSTNVLNKRKKIQLSNENINALALRVEMTLFGV